MGIAKERNKARRSRIHQRQRNKGEYDLLDEGWATTYSSVGDPEMGDFEADGMRYEYEYNVTAPNANARRHVARDLSRLHGMDANQIMSTLKAEKEMNIVLSGEEESFGHIPGKDSYKPTEIERKKHSKKPSDDRTPDSKVVNEPY